MAEKLMQHQEQPTRYGAWLEEKQRQEAVKFAATPERPESDLNSDEEEPMEREQGPKRTVGLRIDPEIYEAFEERAALADQTVSEFLRDLITHVDSPALRWQRVGTLVGNAVRAMLSFVPKDDPLLRQADDLWIAVVVRRNAARAEAKENLSKKEPEKSDEAAPAKRSTAPAKKPLLGGFLKD